MRGARVSIRRALALAAPLVTAAVGGGCGSGATAAADAGADRPPMLDLPAPPTIGTQIDRMGRAGINTLLDDPFDSRDGTGGTPDAIGTARDAYNAETDPAAWPALPLAGGTAVSVLAASLAIIDGFDGKCGNQLPAPATTAPGSATRYAALAALLADDELLVDATRGDCKPVTPAQDGNVTNYFAVEARAVSHPYVTCGGRTPLDDAIDVTYSLLIAGFDGVHFTDGIFAAPDGTPSLTDFPFLAAPH